LLVQNTHTNACNKLRSIKGIFEKNTLFRTLFPELLPKPGDTWKTDSLCINRPKAYAESTFEAAGTRTQLTSRHYNLIIEDDTVAPDLEDLSQDLAAPSMDDIEKAIGWHRLAIPLLNNPVDDEILIVGTRWAELDLLKWIEDHEPDYLFYKRAAREGPDGLPDEGGEVQYPSRFPESVLDGIEHALGPYMYKCLYLNSPVSGSQMTFQASWFRYYETEPQGLMVMISVDLASDPKDLKGRQSDFNVVMVTGKDMKTGNIYVLDFWRARANPGEVLDALFRMVALWKPIKVLIEAIAYQNTLAYWARERMKKQNLWFLVENITHGRAKKEKRILGLVPLVAGGVLKFRSWMKDLVNELLVFPLGAFDDIADALSMHLPWWKLTQTVVGRGRSARDDPFSLDNAIDEILEMSRPERGFPYDVMAVG